MRSTPVQITIASPCMKAWDEMRPVPGGRFCGSCEETVVDFTGMSDGEILRIFQKASTPCGQFRADQLNRPLYPSVVPGPNPWWVKWMLSLGLLTATVSDSVAQKPLKKRTVVTESKKPKIAAADTTTYRITGIVRDGQLGPLINAQIVLMRHGVQIARALTDYDGEFVITTPQKPDTSFQLLAKYQEMEEKICGPFIDDRVNVSFRPAKSTYLNKNYFKGYVVPLIDPRRPVQPVIPQPAMGKETRWQRTKRKARNLFR